MSSEAADGPVLTRIEGDVAHVVLNRPDKLNGITMDVLDALLRAAHDLLDRRDLRAVILSGNGRSFCAGLDIAGQLTDPDAIRRGFEIIEEPPSSGETNLVQEAHWVWRRLDVPVIAAVHGHCFGAGLQLALGADFRFTAPDAQWSVMEAKWGLIPDMTGAQTLSEQIGKDRAKLLTMTARVLTGDQAAEYGLATEVVEDPMAAAEALIDELRTRSPDALAAGKRLFERTWHEPPAATFEAERDLQMQLLRAPNTQVAQRAGMKRETPHYGPRGPLT